MTGEECLSRRDLIHKCLAMGALVLAPAVSVSDALAWAAGGQNAAMSPTPWNELGPFYKRKAPNVAALRAPGCKPLTTQLYFATDPAFEGDPARNFSKDPLVQSVELVRPVTMTKRADASVAAVTFEIVLERL